MDAGKIIIRVILLVLGIHISFSASAQFYIGCDSLVWTKSLGYYISPNSTTGDMELYQDSVSNKLLLVSNLKGKKIICPFSYRIMDDSETGQPYLLFKRYETVNVKLVQRQQVTQLAKYKNFIKVDPLGNSDSDYMATAQETNNGIDELEAMWRLTDNDIPCELFVYFTDNNPRHSPAHYYYLSFGAFCINVKEVSECKRCPVE